MNSEGAYILICPLPVHRLCKFIIDVDDNNTVTRIANTSIFVAVGKCDTKFINIGYTVCYQQDVINRMQWYN